jgi:signal transduction histidine kinase
VEIERDNPAPRRNLSAEAEETLEAIRAGQVDALVVRRNDFEKVYALRPFVEIEQTEAALRKAGLDRKRTLAQLRALAEERERLFQDMHDGCIQSIYAVGLNLEASLRLIEVNPKDARQIIADATANLNLVIEELRSFITGHRLIGRDLRTEIQKMVQAAGNRNVTFTVDIDESAMRGLAPEQALHLLQIAREGISNATRHSNARTGRIALARRQGRICFEVSDDGKGFDAERLDGAGLGLHHIAARAQKMGGRARVSSAPGQGTRIVIDLGKAR